MVRLLVVALGAALVTGLGVAAVLVDGERDMEAPLSPAMNEPTALDATQGALFSDPPGDATEEGLATWLELVGCLPGELLGAGCLGPDAPVPPGTPAPAYDIVGFGLAGESHDTFDLSLEIATLSEGFPELARPDAVHRMSSYAVCWAASPDEGCSRTASLGVMVHDGKAHLEPRLQLYSKDCNEWHWCAFDLDATIAYGSPGTITFHVPKAHAVADGAPLAVHGLAASTGWYEEATVFPMWHPGLTAHTPAYHFHTHGPGVGVPSPTDLTAFERVEATLTPTGALPEAPSDAPLLAFAPGANHGRGSPYDHPELDITGFDLYEEADELVVVFEVAEMAALPEYSFDHSAAIGFHGEVWEIGLRQEGGRAYGYAGRCIMEPCQDGPVMEAPVELAFGTPATISVRVPLAFVGEPEPGTTTNLFWVMSMYSDVNHYWGEQGSELYGDYHSVFMIDSLIGGTPYVFGSGHRVDLGTPSAHAH